MVVSKSEIKIKYLQKIKMYSGKNLRCSKFKKIEMKRNSLIFFSSITNTNYGFIYMIPIVGGVFIYIFHWFPEA